VLFVIIEDLNKCLHATYWLPERYKQKNNKANNYVFVSCTFVVLLLSDYIVKLSFTLNVKTDAFTYIQQMCFCHANQHKILSVLIVWLFFIHFRKLF